MEFMAHSNFEDTNDYLAVGFLELLYRYCHFSLISSDAARGLGRSPIEVQPRQFGSWQLRYCGAHCEGAGN